MLEPVFTLTPEGRAIYAPGGHLLESGDVLAQPGLAGAIEILAAERARGARTAARSRRRCSTWTGIALTRDDLDVVRARVARSPSSVSYAGTRFHTRGGLAGVAETLTRLPRLEGLAEADRVLALLALLDDDGVDGHTTNVTVVDGDGCACVLTTSLGLGTGDFLPGYDLHLNSMLGEVDLHRVPLEPRARMGSMMAPSIAVDVDGLTLAIGSAGGTRLRTALVGVAAGILDEGLEPVEAVARPRFHPVGTLVNAEPGVDEEALTRLERTGRSVRRWRVPAPLLRRRQRRRPQRRGRRPAAQRARGAWLG